MVFGLFARKPQPESNKVQPDATIQLRTPSPSIVSGSSPRADERLPPVTPSPPPDDVLDPTALRALIQSIPPKIVHAYTLSHLPTASPQALAYLSSFFSALEAPPTLHCVRCHKGYFDVENTDRSCLVGHDDDSAEVERVGKGAGYETLYGCCNKTVEGAGDMGPPDGWCYEGMHTTDLKRARFRADSTIHDDKLSSCARLRCHDPQGSASRKRSRRAAEADSDDSDDSDSGASHSSVHTRSRTSKKARTAPGPSSDRMSDDEDVQMPLSAPSSPKRRKPRAKSVAASTSGSVRGKSKAASSAKPRSTAVIHFSDPPASPGKRAKPQSTRLAPAASFVSTTTTSTSTATASASVLTSTSTSTSTSMSTVIAPPSKIKRAMQPKSKPKQQPQQQQQLEAKAKQKQAKRLSEVVESSVPGETA
ncbi:hypothetical protein B0H16DRAFT_1305237 [Mycena metata]|uniref:Uncharacterized protein n=1 Tax=Mycena metata TaxID=1033252 RepID=A0AAD7JWI0_9AGAR|nr:hypothetical protein B0H16DRAFT_1305237 [Mycena metata]